MAHHKDGHDGHHKGHMGGKHHGGHHKGHLGHKIHGMGSKMGRHMGKADIEGPHGGTTMHHK